MDPRDHEYTAVVIGAGIAGLTAAHELAERRFKVWVVEPAQAIDRHRQEGMVIGGMARTQYIAVPKRSPAAHPLQAGLKAPPFPKILPSEPIIPALTLSEGNKGTMELLEDYLEVYIKPEDSPHRGKRLRIVGANTEFRNKVVETIKEETHVEPDIEPETSGIESTPSRITIVQRERHALLEIGTNGLSPEGAYRLRQFVASLTPGSTVFGNVSKSRVGARAAAQIRRALMSLHIFPPRIADVDETQDFAKVWKGAQRLTLRLGDDGMPQTEDAMKLGQFLRMLVPGDVVELHIANVNRSNPLVDNIMTELRELAVHGLLIIRKNGNLISDPKILAPYGNLVILPALPVAEDQHVVPGEHGFRFFPAYYRHLRNSLERIPVFDTREGPNDTLSDRLSGRAVIDNLVNTPVQALAGVGINPIAFPRTPSVSPTALFMQLRDLLLERGYDIRDVQQFILRVMRYMATGSLRREAELESLSWWEYLCGYDPASGASRYQYSDSFTRDIGESPRILAAFDSQWGDARTNGSTFVQLLLTHFLENEAVDQVLNAPTTEAWFEHWQKYLQTYLDVTFVAARVTALTGIVANGVRSVRPTLEPVGAANADFDELKDHVKQGRVTYYVLATDAPAAEELVETLKADFRIGAARELRGFVSVVRSSPKGDVARRPRYGKRFGDEPWDRFQTLTGIQFYFVQPTGIFDGHVYFMEAPWALSSINQHQFWRFSPITRGAPYQSVLSADVGRFEEAWKMGLSAQGKNKIANSVWNQITDALQDYWNLHTKDPAIVDLRNRGPRWFHLDGSIELGTIGVPGTLPENFAPYLIPIVCDWQSRPRDSVWDPGESRSAEPLPPATDELWHAPWGGYRIHWRQWVFAGTYLRHFTRMTTMEAANESGRHAVNAILDHRTYVEHSLAGAAEADSSPLRHRYHTGGNPLDPHAAYVPTPYGDYCHIWDPEKYELADFVPWRELDDWLFEQGMAHAWDLTGQEVIPSLLSYMPGAHDMGLPSFNDILRAITPPFTPPPGAATAWGWKP